MESYNDEHERSSGGSPTLRTSEGFGQDASSLHSGSDDLEGPIEVCSLRLTNTHSAPLSRQATSIRTTATTDPRFEVDWGDEKDPSNPRNWALWYKSMIVAFLSFSTWVVILYSTAYASAIPGIMSEFHVTSEPVATLGLTTYLIGLAVGSLILAPLSELYGRRPVYMVNMILFVLLVLPCALATSLPEILIIRFFGAFAGSVMIANAPGSISDIVDDEYRALAFSLFALGPMNGPVFGPLISGFTSQHLGWRWTNWLVLIFGGIALTLMALVKETYAPTILRKKAKLRRKETGDARWWSRYDQKLGFWSSLKVNLARPFVMLLIEPICIFWALYVAVVYGILYLCFVAYPIVFTQIRGWEAGISGLAFLGICVGTTLALAFEPVFRQIINRHKADPETGRAPPEAMMSIVCIAALLTPLGQLWFAWTCVPTSLHWIWPILAGVPFGAGNAMVFIYATNYLAHSYGIYAASALAGNSLVRSLLGGTLPLAGPSMYRTLNPHWAGTLLGLLEVLLIPIPFAFYKYGHRIRMRSPLIRSMQEDKAKLAGKRSKLKAEEDRRREKQNEASAEKAV